jgi:hypothetical protein
LGRHRSRQDRAPGQRQGKASEQFHLALIIAILRAEAKHEKLIKGVS